MAILILVLTILLIASLVYFLAGMTVLKNPYHWKFGLIATATLGGIVACLPPDERLKRGIDLAGGTILVYQLKPEERAAAGDAKRPAVKMSDLIGSLKRRVNPEGVRDIPIRQVGNDRVEIILPKATAEQVDEVKRLITDVGSLQFRILANMKHDRAAIERAQGANGLIKPPKKYAWARLGEVVTGKDPKVDDSTHITDPTKLFERDRYAGTPIALTGKDSRGRDATVSVDIAANSAQTITLKKAHGLAKITSYQIDYNPSRIVPSDNAIVREDPRPDGVTVRYILYRDDPQDVTGNELSHVYATHDERLQPAVGFVFSAAGGRKFGRLTGSHLPEESGAFMYHLAIILDDMVMSAPVIKSEIRDQGIIENMQAKEVDHLINILRSGSLPASIDPTPLQEENIGPTLGRDTIEKGIFAIGISMLVVPIFMIVYYRFAGLVAVVALVLNMLLLVGSMALTDSTFTLPGLAGLALTIGMAVDANVLIFERMREEAERGASMTQQIRNGFARAWTTILDSNVTTMLSGAVLWAIGTEEIKGFALTLIIGLLWNLFTAVFVSRVIFDYCNQRGWLKKLTMMKIKLPQNVDFIGPRKYLMTASAIVIAIGLAWFFKQGSDNYNIDFTGGTLVTIQLNDKAPDVARLSEGQRAAYVRQKAGEVLPDVSVESLNVAGEARGTRFNIRTTNDKDTDVQAKVRKQFATTLSRLEMTASKPEPIAEAGPSQAAAGAPAARFAGGRRFELTFNRRTVDPEKVKADFAQVLRTAKVPNPESRFEIGLPPVAARRAEEANQRLILSTNLDEPEARRALDTLGQTLANDPNLLFERLTNFGSAVAHDTQNSAIKAIFASWAIMIAYLWLRFKSVTYGLAAVVALVHDVLFTLGAVAISPYKIDLPMVAAFLTLIGFSVNDTIVIFDRIREIKGKSPYLTGAIINAAVNQTLSRTILTSLTAWLVVAILWLFGGEGLAGFSFCLVVGFLSGTYSTIYIASPILIDWMARPPAEAAKARAAQMATREA